MYRALVETRALGPRLGRQARLPKGLEACWVGPAIDLREGDLTSTSVGGSVIEYIRSAGTRESAGPATVADVRRLISADIKQFAGNTTDRLLCAVGAAMAVKSAAAGQVVMAHTSAGDLSKSDWKRLVLAGGDADLPLILVVAPSKGAGRPVTPGLTVIPVDAGDPVAIYRVAQESILRARGQGGMVIIECVATGTDPVKLLGRQLRAKGIATERWVQGVEEQFRRTIARL